MRPWMRRMTVEDVGSAKKLSDEHTEQEIVAMAARCYAKSQRIKLWFLASCLAPFAVLIAPLVRPSIMHTSFPLWMVAMIAAMLLPLPARVAASRVGKEGAVISLAFWLKKHPDLLQRLRSRR